MAHHFVDAGAAVLGETFVAVGGADGAVVGGVFGHQAVDGFCAHSFLDFGSDEVEKAGVDDAGAANAFDVLSGLDERIGRHDESLLLHLEDAAIEVCGGVSFGHDPILFM